MRHIKSVQDLFWRTPEDWHNAPVVISDSVGVFEPILRVSFQEDGDGKRVVVLHKSSAYGQLALRDMVEAEQTGGTDG